MRSFISGMTNTSNKSNSKTITILDYSATPKSIVINNFKDVVKINVRVVSGDEILEVLFNDYRIEHYDSYTDRCEDYPDSYYCIYDTTKKINNLRKWSKRSNSYDYERNYK